MKNKEKDILYCGVDQHVIETRAPRLDPEALKVFNFFIKERYKIHIKKDVNKEQAPWTDDYILSTYKFTNIRREHDRTSKWLIDHISNNKSISLYDRIYKTILFRTYNNFETAEIIDLEHLSFHDKDDVKDGWIYIAQMKLDKAIKENPGIKLYTNAYKTGGIKRGMHNVHPESGHYNYAPLYYLEELRDQHFAQKLLDCKSQEEVYWELCGIKGFGRFVAYQVYVDLTYINEFPFSENEYIVAGPGCYYGLQLLTGKDDKDSGFNYMSSEEILFWLRNNIVEEFHKNNLEFDCNEVFSDLPEDERHFNVMSLENIMCEFSKYYSLYTGQRKCRKKYRPYSKER